MPHNYFVTGLPRSRTAWFSEWLPDCLHEGMEGCYTHEDYLKKLKRGDSSCGLMYFPIRKYFPESPVLIVERAFEDVVESLISIDLFDDDTYGVLVDAQKRLNEMDGLRVNYYSLDLEEIWNYLIGTNFDRKRAEVMSMKNIQKINYSPDLEAMSSFIGESQCLG